MIPCVRSWYSNVVASGKGVNFHLLSIHGEAQLAIFSWHRVIYIFIYLWKKTINTQREKERWLQKAMVFLYIFSRWLACAVLFCSSHVSVCYMLSQMYIQDQFFAQCIYYLVIDVLLLLQQIKQARLVCLPLELPKICVWCLDEVLSTSYQKKGSFVNLESG